MNTRVVGIVVGVALIVASVMLGLGYSETAQQVDELRQQSASNAGAAEDAVDAAQALAEQVRSLGQTPVVEPDRLRSAQGERGRRGPGPTQAQVAAAVAAYCAGGECAGPGPTPEQVAAAVEAYCADDRCRGEQGDEGQAAEGPSPDDIADAVAAYCAQRDQCRGPRGEQGAVGAEGERGPPGGTCPDGQTRQPYTYPDGRDGSRCVAPPPEPGEQPPSDEPPPDDEGNGPIPGG